MDNRVESKLKPWEIDDLNMKNLNTANRLYRKCFSGKCPPAIDRFSPLRRQRRQKNFISKKLQDRKLGEIWVENGRTRRLKALEAEMKEVKTKIVVASGKTHLVEQEKNFKRISLSIRNMETMDEEINKAKTEIVHLKSQIVRLNKKAAELSLETESEGKVFFQAFFCILPVSSIRRSVLNALAKSKPSARNLWRTSTSFTSTWMRHNYWEPKASSTDHRHASWPCRVQSLLVQACRESERSSNVSVGHDRTIESSF